MTLKNFFLPLLAPIAPEKINGREQGPQIQFLLPSVVLTFLGSAIAWYFSSVNLGYAH